MGDFRLKPPNLAFFYDLGLRLQNTWTGGLQNLSIFAEPWHFGQLYLQFYEE